MRKLNAPPGATTSEVPFAAPGAGWYIVTVGIATFLTMRDGTLLPGTCTVCSCQFHCSEPGGTPEPGQIANTPAASDGRSTKEGSCCAFTVVVTRVASKTLMGRLILEAF